MESAAPKRPRKPAVRPLRTALRDALVVGLLIFCSFLGSALLVLWNVELRERDRIRAKLEAAAWKAAAVVHQTVYGSPTGAADSAGDGGPEVLRRLRELAAEHSLVREVFYLHDAGGQFHARGLQAPGREVEWQLADQARRSMASTTARVEATPERNLVCTVPILADSGFAHGVVVASSRALRETDEVAGARIGFALAAGVGTLLALAVGLAVYRSSRRFHDMFGRLAETEQRLRDVSNASGEFIWEVDPSWSYTFLSARVRDVLGYEPEEMLGRRVIDFVPRDDLGEVRGHFELLASKGDMFRDFEFRATRKDGSSIWLTASGVPVEGGRFRGTARDITARKESQRELTREKEAAQAAMIAKSQFLAMMSHEIRTPLNSVLGFAELLERTRLDTAQREHLGMIRRSGDALLALLNDILQFSRYEFSNVSLENEPTELRSFLREVLELHRPAADEKGILLELAVEPSVPAWLAVDRARLRQLLLNLVGNAVKFTVHGSVSVRAEGRAGKMPGDVYDLCLTVRDTGVGMAPETVPMLFKPFSQGDSSTTRKFGGTGLGLAICRRLAKLFGGSVKLVETSPQGSTFQFCAPFRICDPAGPPPAPGPAPVAPAAGIVRGRQINRILVAEDNHASRKLMAMILAPVCAEVELVENGADAVKAHRAKPFDVILMDLQMPEMDGLEATREIRRLEAERTLPTRVTIIALTANALSGDRERCIEAGMDDYLTKPVRKADLVRALLSGPALQTAR